MKDPKLYLIHMLECADRISEYATEGREGFLKDRKTQDAIVRNFEIIGEAAKRVPEEYRKREPGVPWKQIGGFRDVLIHEYEGIEPEEVWKRVAEDLPVLKEALKRLLGSEA